MYYADFLVGIFRSPSAVPDFLASILISNSKYPECGGWKPSQLQCMRLGFISPEKKNISALSRRPHSHSAWFSDTSGRSNVCFQLPGFEQILSKNKTLFYTDFLRIFFCSRNFFGNKLLCTVVFTGCGGQEGLEGVDEEIDGEQCDQD